MYIALFSHFIPCGVYEAIYILDGLIKNESDIQPDTLHGDTHAQSAPVFGLAYLLGINLMPRIRNLKKLVLFKPDRGTRYEHIDGLFSETINWSLIETHLPDMLRIALSIKAGKITPSTILRRLGTASRKNKLYFAFRELGRVVRTEFLLRYISDLELRKTIQAATNKSMDFTRNPADPLPALFVKTRTLCKSSCNDCPPPCTSVPSAGQSRGPSARGQRGQPTYVTLLALSRLTPQ